jgi:hypothetical protein
MPPSKRDMFYPRAYPVEPPEHIVLVKVLSHGATACVACQIAPASSADAPSAMGQWADRAAWVAAPHGVALDVCAAPAMMACATPFIRAEQVAQDLTRADTGELVYSADDSMQRTAHRTYAAPT